MSCQHWGHRPSAMRPAGRDGSYRRRSRPEGTGRAFGSIRGPAQLHWLTHTLCVSWAGAYTARWAGSYSLCCGSISRRKKFAITLLAGHHLHPSAFGHSGAAAMSTIGLPGWIVESLIAFSIALVALENLFTVTTAKWRTLIVFGLGLIHGLGFASFFSELGLPQGLFSARLSALTWASDSASSR